MLYHVRGLADLRLSSPHIDPTSRSADHMTHIVDRRSHIANRRSPLAHCQSQFIHRPSPLASMSLWRRPSMCHMSHPSRMTSHLADIRRPRCLRSPILPIRRRRDTRPSMAEIPRPQVSTARIPALGCSHFSSRAHMDRPLMLYHIQMLPLWQPAP